MKKIAMVVAIMLLAGCNAPLAATNDPNVGGGRAVIVGQMPTPAGTAVPVKQAVQPGGGANSVVSTGSLTFTLDAVATQGSATLVTYQVQGLPKDFSERADVSDPWIVLPSGEIILTRVGEGGGSPAGTSTQIQFTALPATTRSFTLAIPNTWTGSLQTWYIPVRMN